MESSSSKSSVLEIHTLEYSRLRDEIVERIKLQNTLIQHGITLAAAAAGLIVTLFQFFQPEQMISISESKFVGVGLSISFVYGLLAQLLLWNWIYQLQMIFRISAYVWYLRRRISSVINVDSNEILLWEAGRETDPWNTGFVKLPFTAMQPLVIYGLASLAPVATLGFSIAQFSKTGFDATVTTGLVETLVLMCGLIIAVLLQIALHQTSGNKRTDPNNHPDLSRGGPAVTKTSATDEETSSVVRAQSSPMDPTLLRTAFQYSQEAVATALERLEVYARRAQIYLLVLGGLGTALVFNAPLRDSLSPTDSPLYSLIGSLLLTLIYLTYVISVFFTLRALKPGQTMRFPQLNKVISDIQAGVVSREDHLHLSILEFHKKFWRVNINLLNTRGKSLMRADRALCFLVVLIAFFLTMLTFPLIQNAIERPRGRVMSNEQQPEDPTAKPTNPESPPPESTPSPAPVSWDPEPLTESQKPYPGTDLTD